MADINGGQRFAGRTDFIRQYLSIIFLKLGINQNHLIFAADDFRGNREDTFSPGLYTSSDRCGGSNKRSPHQGAEYQ